MDNYFDYTYEELSEQRFKDFSDYVDEIMQYDFSEDLYDEILYEDY